MANPRIENVTETWQMLKPDPRQDGDTHVYDMDPETDDEIKSTLKSSRLGEEFFGYRHPNRYTGGFDGNGNYTGGLKYQYQNYYRGHSGDQSGSKYGYAWKKGSDG